MLLVNIVDVIIILLLLGSLVRGAQAGSLRQILSTGGFFAGLFAGAWAEPHLSHLVHSQLSKSILAIVLALGGGLVVMSIAEYFGVRLKRRLQKHEIDRVDGVLGAVVGAATLLLTVWLGAALLVTLPYSGLQDDLRGSAIISQLTKTLPAAPPLVADLGHLINPNGFPQVFTGVEPTPTTTTLPALASLQPAVNRDQASVVKIEGEGCGGIIEGSGFVVAPGIVVSNAHVVAGVAQPYVFDLSGQHKATAIWFDPNLDLTVLSVKNLNDPPLTLNTKTAARGTASAVLGYPGGGDFSAQPAVVLDEFMATGKNIYNQGAPNRDIYELQAHVIPGNSGGPLIAADGSVIGVVFAQSTVYNNIGYALTLGKVSSELRQAEAQNTPVSTGSCAQ